LSLKVVDFNFQTNCHIISLLNNSRCFWNSFCHFLLWSLFCF